MSIPRGQCACGATILIPLAADRETLGFFIRAHNDSERHMAWSRARIDPSFPVATMYNDAVTEVTADAAAGSVLAHRLPPRNLG